MPRRIEILRSATKYDRLQTSRAALSFRPTTSHLPRREVAQLEIQPANLIDPSVEHVVEIEALRK